MANSSYIDKAKAGASKTMLKELPRILWESAAIGENKYKYIKPDGEELTIEMNDTDAKSLAYAATKMAERLIELSNKTDGFYTAFDILEQGRIITRRDKEHEELLAIRNGKYMREDGSYAPEFFEFVDQLETKFQRDVKKTELPAKPDFAKIEELLVEINKSYLHRIM